jgi:hypothetical protein
VPQQRRRAEIVRFKNDPTCRLFLSTDSGSVGLNLQVANAVVNVDLPWNPAKLEQRIARAWRKHQQRAVTVVNLVCEDSIEHGMVHLLGAKQALADGVLDGQGDLAALKMPSGRAGMIERMQALMQAGERAAGAPPRAVPPEETISEDLQRRHGARALLIEARQGGDGRTRMLAVLDLDGRALAIESKRLAGLAGAGPGIEVIDRAAWLAIERLQAGGVLQFTGGPSRVLHRAAGLAEDGAGAARARAVELRAQAEREVRKAQVLSAGGFPEEAPALLARAIGIAGAARLALLDELPDDASAASPLQIKELAARKLLPVEATATLDVLTAAASPSHSEVDRLLSVVTRVVVACGEGPDVAPPISEAVFRLGRET